MYKTDHRLKIILALSAALLMGAQSESRSPRTWDIGFVTGMGIGTITDPSRDTPIALGGVPLSLRITDDRSKSLSYVYQAGLLVDIVSNQVVRRNVEMGFSYHVMGGSRKIQRNTSLATIKGRSSSNVSLNLRGSLSGFSASLIDDPDNKVTGSILEIKPGASYRFNFFFDSAIEIEGMLAVIGFPASTHRITHSGVEINVVWRKDL